VCLLGSCRWASNRVLHFCRRMGLPTKALSKVQGLENDTFDVGASSHPAKFSKLLKNIKNYIQKTYKDPDDMVKTIQR